MNVSFVVKSGTWTSPQHRQKLCWRRSNNFRVFAAAESENSEVEDRGKASAEDIESAKKSTNEIYIGFEKADYAPRKGRKGRVVTDDPSRYPVRDAFSGGWAGGEVGLKQFVQEANESKQKVQKAKVIGTTEDSEGTPQKRAITEDGEEIYIGFSKAELEQRKAGGKGTFIRDDPRRYPDKETVGAFPGVTGGFAGGEKGVKQFVESGDINFSEKGRKEFSPVALAGFVAFGVTTGAIVLNSGVLLSEQALGGSSLVGEGAESFLSRSNALTDSLAVDEKTKLLLNAAVVFLGVGAVIIGARAIVRQIQESSVKLKDDAINIGKASVFWLAVLLATLYIVDYQ